MRTRRLPSLLLGLALLLTQWLSFAHAIEHPALTPDKSCAVCILGISLDNGVPLPQALALVLPAPVHVVTTWSAIVFDDRRPASTRARAPPHALV